MSKRLQILVTEEEAEQFRQSAERERTSLSQWARRAMLDLNARQAGRSPEHKLLALDRALQCEHPTGAIDQLLAEIEAGRDLR